MDNIIDFFNRIGGRDDKNFGLYFKYADSKDNISIRRIVPSSIKIVYESNEEYPEPQWIMHAVDMNEKAVVRFALSNIVKIYKSYDEFKNDLN